ncbi:GLIPR1-like protein 1 isoform X1 [Danio rerio]|uniref:GLIPR1-like protein 1 isoform X1 n=1 Tax=Danio rerio TaxID=7955 RepID=A0A8M6YY67_DANRE|nr:GLIPR1-like protein 1 isoform X1 [Danio rerio]|eukprot:XP_017210734.1 GLIPR1-like protein 1 isoform X1 [Danio rerio]
MSSCFQLLISACFLLGVFSSEYLFDITDRAFIDECVREHNQNRSSVSPTAANMRYMTWDAALAVTARAWARFCLFKHNIHLREAKRVHPTFTTVGENIWAGAPYSRFTVKSAVFSWVNELKDYNYNNNQCNDKKVCGHYTQVVWADSYKVGCAVQTCPNGVAETHFSNIQGVIFVCNYATAGNFAGRSPYKQGASCSGCGGSDKCERNLCRNTDRDAEQSYNWTPDWDPALSSCGTFCVSVMIIRLISVVLLFVCVHFLQCRYSPFIYD